jgi:thymidylate synthase (FAD)
MEVTPLIEVTLLAITPDSERLIESAGRTCYLSFDREGHGTEVKFIRSLVKNGHLSVLEHAYATFRIKGASRSFTHQIVRHRLCSFSQQSQRYVNEKGFSFVTPPSIAGKPEANEAYLAFMEEARQCYMKLQELGVPNQDARFVLPNATESEIVLSANFREFRHIFEHRCHPAAQWEIRRVCCLMLEKLKAEAPTVFEDFVIDYEKWTAKSPFSATE